MARRDPDLIDEHVGRRVRMRRRELHMSQSKLAERLGLTFQQIQKYERGANRISASKLFLIAEALEAPVSFFFDGLGSRASLVSPHSDIMDRFVMLDESRDLAEVFIRLGPAKVRRALVTFLQLLQERPT